MNLYVLITPETGSVPDTMKAHYFGSETIVDRIGAVIAQGTIAYVQGEAADFIKWLGHLDGFWTTSHPMTGDWKVLHVKESLKCHE